MAKKLYYLSKKEAAKAFNGNRSDFTYAGIPILLSALRCLMIEFEAEYPRNQNGLEELNRPGDFMTAMDRYGITDPLRQDAQDLYELRNEISHPAHLPPGTPDNWPDYLRHVKNKGLLESSGREDVDYCLMDQIASHRLFGWACKVTRDLAFAVLNSSSDKGGSKRRFIVNFEFYDDVPGEGSI